MIETLKWRFVLNARKESWTHHSWDDPQWARCWNHLLGWSHLGEQEWMRTWKGAAKNECNQRYVEANETYEPLRLSCVLSVGLVLMALLHNCAFVQVHSHSSGNSSKTKNQALDLLKVNLFIQDNMEKRSGKYLFVQFFIYFSDFCKDFFLKKKAPCEEWQWWRVRVQDFH